MSYNFKVTGQFVGTDLEMKDCHFCGNAVSLYQETYHGDYFVRCHALICHASGPQRDTPETAVMSWNDFCVADESDIIDKDLFREAADD